MVTQIVIKWRCQLSWWTELFWFLPRITSPGCQQGYQRYAEQVAAQNIATGPYHIDGFVQDCSNSNAFEMELQQSCTKPSRYTVLFFFIKFTYLRVPKMHWILSSKSKFFSSIIYFIASLSQHLKLHDFTTKTQYITCCGFHSTGIQFHLILE